jgi:hypothetical protein
MAATTRTSTPVRPGRPAAALLALAATVAAALLVGATVTAVLAFHVARSLLVGLPAGLVTGVLTLVAPGVRARDERRARRALAAGWFGVALLVVAVAGGALLGVTLGLVAGVVAGTVAVTVVLAR